MAAASGHPSVDVANDDTTEAYLSHAVKLFAPLPPVDGNKDACSLHSSSNSSLPQSMSISQLGPTHSGVFTGRSSVTSWEIDDVRTHIHLQSVPLSRPIALRLPGHTTMGWLNVA